MNRNNYVSLNPSIRRQSVFLFIFSQTIRVFRFSLISAEAELADFKNNKNSHKLKSLNEIMTYNEYIPCQLYDGLCNTGFNYSTITSFYHIRTKERAKYESVLHCSKRIAL